MIIVDKPCLLYRISLNSWSGKELSLRTHLLNNDNIKDVPLDSQNFGGAIH